METISGFFTMVAMGVAVWLILIFIFKAIDTIAEIFRLKREYKEIKKLIEENNIKIAEHNQQLVDINRKFEEDMKILEIKHQAQIDTLKEVERRFKNEL